MKNNFKYIKDRARPTKIHTKTGKEIPNFKRVSSNSSTWQPQFPTPEPMVKMNNVGSRRWTFTNPRRLPIKRLRQEMAKARRKHRDEVLRPKWKAKAEAKLVTK